MISCRRTGISVREQVPEIVQSAPERFTFARARKHVGRLTSVIGASGRSSFDYDYAGRVTAGSTEVNIGGQLTETYTLGRTYDALGRIESITYPAPDNETIVYGYDNNGNLGSVTRQGGRRLRRHQPL